MSSFLASAESKPFSSASSRDVRAVLAQYGFTEVDGEDEEPLQDPPTSAFWHVCSHPVYCMSSRKPFAKLSESDFHNGYVSASPFCVSVGIPEIAPFPFWDYFNENAAAADLAKEHREHLQACGVKMGRGGFDVMDLHDQNDLLELPVGEPAQYDIQ